MTTIDLTHRDDLPALHDALIAWFTAHNEDLPWRHTSDPYAVWLSEIMLQRTQPAPRSTNGGRGIRRRISG